MGEKSEVAMELIIVLLSSMGGALIGTCTGIFMMYRRLRPISGTDLDMLRGKLRSAEFSLDAKTAGLENLKKLMAEREQAMQQSGEELKGMQQRLATVQVAGEEGSTQRADAERKIHELTMEAAALREQLVEFESRASQEKRQIAEQAEQQLSAAQVQLQSSTLQIQELTERVARLTQDTVAMKQGWNEDAHARAALEKQLADEQEQTRELSNHVAELQEELLRSDQRLRDERNSAAKGMELLAMAQESIARVLRSGGVEAAALRSERARSAAGRSGRAASLAAEACRTGIRQRTFRLKPLYRLVRAAPPFLRWA